MTKDKTLVIAIIGIVFLALITTAVLKQNSKVDYILQKNAAGEPMYMTKYQICSALWGAIKGHTYGWSQQQANQLTTSYCINGCDSYDWTWRSIYGITWHVPCRRAN